MSQKELIQISIILGVSLLFGLGYNVIRDDGIPLIAKKKVYEQADITELERNTTKVELEPIIKIVDLTMAKELYDRGVTFVDARDETEFSEGHIKGALNVSSIQLAELISFDEPILTYCSGEDCELSITLAEELADFGFSTIFVFNGGWPEWESANYPVGMEQ